MKSPFALVFIPFVALFLGCGGGASQGGASTQQTTQSINVAGTWQMTAKSSVFAITPVVNGVINQTGNALSGQLTISGSPCAPSAPMTGTVSGAALSIQLNENGQTVVLSGTVSEDGNSASGTYSAPVGGCTSGDSGTWSGQRLPQISSIALNPTSVLGGTTSTGTVTLSAAAPTGGGVVNLSSNNTAAVAVPVNLTVAAGMTTGTFTATTHSVSTATSVTISGTYNGTQTATLAVTPPVLSSLSLNPTSVIAGAPSVGTVTLTGAAPAAGSVVALTSSNAAAAQVSASVTVPAGSSTATFQLTTPSNAAAGSVTITAQFGATQTAVLTVNASSAASVNLTGNWQASFTSSISFNNSVAVYGYFSQSGNSTTANLHIDGSSCYSNVNLFGVVSVLVVQFSVTNGAQTVTLSGTASANGNAMQGTYSVSGGCAGGDTGTWAASRIPAGECVPSPVGLLSWWRGEGNATDSMGGNPGTATGAVSYVTGIVGQAFALDGSTGYVNVPDSSSIESAKTTESVELWVNPLTPPTIPEYVYAHREPLINESFSLFVMPNGALGVLIGTTTSPTQGGSKFLSSAGSITFGQFQHIVATANTTTGVVRVYLNGNQIALSDASGPSSLSGSFNTSNQLYLGRREDLSVGEGVSGAGYLNGLMDEVSLYATELDPAQVEFLFQAGSGGKCPAVPTGSQPARQGTLDQSFTTVPSGAGTLSSYIGGYVAQTFTASVSGYLTGVNVDIESQPISSSQTSPFPLNVSILATANGVPTSTVLASAIVGPGNIGIGSPVTFEQPASVVAGGQYAIAVSYVGVPSGSGAQGLWIGALGHGYSGGLTFGSTDETHWVAGPDGGDLFFQTYIAQ